MGKSADTLMPLRDWDPSTRSWIVLFSAQPEAAVSCVLAAAQEIPADQWKEDREGSKLCVQWKDAADPPHNLFALLSSRPGLRSLVADNFATVLPAALVLLGSLVGNFVQYHYQHEDLKRVYSEAKTITISDKACSNADSVDTVVDCFRSVKATEQELIKDQREIRRQKNALHLLGCAEVESNNDALECARHYKRAELFR